MESVLTKAGVLGAPIPAYPFCRSGHHFSLLCSWYGSAVYARNIVFISVVATVFFWIRASVLHCRYALLLDPFTSSTQAVEAKASSATGILPCLCRACSLPWRWLFGQALLRASWSNWLLPCWYGSACASESGVLLEPSAHK